MRYITNLQFLRWFTIFFVCRYPTYHATLLFIAHESAIGRRHGCFGHVFSTSLDHQVAGFGYFWTHDCWPRERWEMAQQRLATIIIMRHLKDISGNASPFASQYTYLSTHCIPLHDTQIRAPHDQLLRFHHQPLRYHEKPHPLIPTSDSPKKMSIFLS